MKTLSFFPRKPIFFLVLAIVAIVAISFIRPAAAPEVVAIDADRFRPPGEFGQPYREITPDHKIDRIRHKDVNGLSPLELVRTAEGMITIQRTFSTAGALLKEEAFLNGRPVPVPRR